VLIIAQTKKAQSFQIDLNRGDKIKNVFSGNRGFGKFADFRLVKS